MKRFVLLLLLLPFFLSCEKETFISVDQTSINVSDAGGSSTVSLTANKPWTASSNQSWCKVSPSSGEEATSSRITISCDPNTTYDARNATVTFTCAELTKTISVSQATNNGLLVSQTSYELTKAAQQLSIQVQANVKFSVDVDNGCKDWVKYNTTKGLTTSTVVLDIAENKTYDSREGKVTIKQDGGSLSSTVTIKQSQLDGLFLTTSEYNLSNDKHTLTVEVKSNIDYEVKSEADWIKYVETKGLKTNQIILDVSANETYDAREGEVIVKQKNGDLTGTITVKQEQNYGLILSQTSFDLGNDSQTIDVEVKYNVDFDVIIPSGCKDWIKQVSTKGLNSRTYTFNIAKNETYDAREGSITFKQKNGALSGTVSVKQSQNNGLFVTKSDYEINNESQTVNVEVKANIDFEVKSESDWVKVVETKGLKTSTIVLSIEENDGYDAREGKVSVTQKDGDLKGTINIKQKGKNGIVLPQTEFELTNEAQTLNVEVQSTVQFEVQISDSGKNWVSLVSTKALDTKTCTFSIKKNETYDNRQCSVTFKQKGGALSGTISIRQAQTDTIIAEQENYSLSYEEQQLSINISSNVEYEVIIDEDCSGWINRISTKGLEGEAIVFHVAENEGEERKGKITFKGATIQATVLVKQQAGVVVFEDDLFEAYCVTNFDKNGDGKVSLKEARDVEEIDVYCRNDIKSLKGVECFINLKKLRCGWNSITTLDVSHNTSLTHLGCDNNKLKSLDVSHNTALQELACFSNKLSSLDVSKNTSLTNLVCGWNNIKSLDVSHNTALVELGCDANPLTSLDVRNNKALTSLACYSDGLTELDLSQNNKLQVLVCFSNQLKSMELSHNPELTHLECNDNKLTSLDVSYNIYLNTLKCEDNPFLKEIWLRKGQTISTFSYDKSVATIKYKYYSEYYGDLAKIITPLLGTEEADAITEMIVFGKLDATDFEAMRELPNLSSVDLSQIQLMNDMIPSQAFANCYSLKDIVFPETLHYILNDSFKNCYRLQSVAFPSSLSGIGSYAFYGCTSLSELKLPNSLDYIDDFAFASCSGLSGDLILPENLKAIGTSCFSNCIGFNGKLVLPSNVRIGSYAFDGCKNFTGDLIVPSTVNLGNYCFNNTGFTGSVYTEAVGWYSFYGCNIGENLIITKVSHIGRPFRYVHVAGYIYLGENSTSIEDQCFAPCWCNKFYVAAVTPPTCSGDAIRLGSCYLGVPKGRLEAYKNADKWKDASVIEEVDFSTLKLKP